MKRKGILNLSSNVHSIFSRDSGLFWASVLKLIGNCNKLKRDYNFFHVVSINVYKKKKSNFRNMLETNFTSET